MMTATYIQRNVKAVLLILSIGFVSVVKTNAACTTISGQPSNASGCKGTNVSFTITTSGNQGSPTYQWYVSSDGGTTWITISNGGVYSNATTTTLNLTGIKASMTGLKYRCVMTKVNPCSGTTNSNAATLTVTGTSFQASTSSIYGYYPFNGDANDESGMNNTGTLQNAPTLTTDRFGNANKAYSFNGSTQYVSTANSFSNPSNFTISAWFKTTTIQGGRIIGFGDAQTGASSNYDRFIWMSNDGKLYFAVNPGGVGYSLNSTYAYNDGSWHLVTATCSSTNGSKLYVDGSLVSSNTNAKGGQNYTGYWRINYDGTWGPYPSSNYFNGSMDDIFIYQTELTASQVATLYTNPEGAGSSPVCNGGTLNLTAPASGTYSWTGPNSFTSTSQNPTVSSMSSAKTGTYTLTYTNGGCSYTSYTIGTTKSSLGPNISTVPSSGLLSWYKFDGDASDVQMIDHGSFQGSTPTATTDRFGKANSAYTFDGSSQFVSTGLQYSNPTDLSISAWFKTTTTSGGKIIGFGHDQTVRSTNFDRHIYMGDDGKLNFGINAGNYVITSPSAYNDGTWHQVIGILSSSAGISLYVDGTLVASNSNAKTPENYNGYWRIGYDAIGSTWANNPTSDFFGGSLDDVMIYNRAISSSEVTTLYTSGAGAGSNSPVCSTNSINLTSSTIASSTYSWTGPNSFTSTSQNPSISNSTSSNTGTYSVKVTVTATGCQNTGYTNVTVYTTPTVTGSTTACDGATASFTGTGSPIQWQLSTDGGSTYYSLTNTNPYSGVTTTTLSISKVTEIMNGFKFRTYNNGCISPTSGTLNVNPAVNSLPNTSLIGYYPFNGNANDEGGTGNTGTLQNAPTLTADRFGNANSAYSFDGSSQYVSTTRSFTNINDFTLSIWFKTNTVLGGKLIGIGNRQTGTSTAYDRHIYMNNKGQIYFGTWNGTVTTINSTYSYNDDNWHLATASMSSTNGMKLYIDGSLVASNSSVTTAENATEYWKIGYDQMNTGWPSYPSSNYFHGTLDDVMIFNTELSATNVSTLYSSTFGASSNSPVCNGGTLNLSATTVSGATYAWTGPNSFSSGSQNPSVTSMSSAKEGTYTLTVTASGCTSTGYALGKINSSLGPNISQIPTTGLQSHYKLDGNANDDLNRNNGRLQNAPSLTSDRFGNANSAYTFDGSTQYISTSASYLNPTNVTLSVWFKTTTTSGGRIIGFGNAQTGLSGNYDRHIYMNNAGQIYFGVNPSQGLTTLNTTASYNDGNWHHVVGTVSGTSGICLYVDGALIGSNTTPLGGENYTGYWKIGYDQLTGWPSTPTSNYFNGTIDEVLIYSGTAISAANVTTLYNSPDGAGNNGPVCTGSALTFNATTVSGASYAWNGPNSYSSAVQNATIASYLSANAGVYTLTVTQSGCTSKAYTIVTNKTTGAGQWTGTASNDWSNTDNWCNVSLPTSSDNVTIPSGTTYSPQITSTASTSDLSIASGATLTLLSGKTLNVGGNWNNSGTFTDNGGTTTFNGSSAQSITGATTINNLTINNSNGVTLNNVTMVNGILTLTSGTLATGGNLTVNLNTGAISGNGTGSVSGNITVKKNLNVATDHFISTPLSSTTIAQLTDDIYLTNGYMYYYDESLVTSDSMSGWVDFGNYTNAPLSSMTGYDVYLDSPTNLIDITGSYVHANSYSKTVTHTNTNAGNLNTGGWNLVGNPYPSALDWDAASGWTKTNLDNSFYIWDPNNSRYATYASGTGTNGGTKYIPSMQGFWVHVSNVGSGTIAVDNNARTTSSNPSNWKMGVNNIKELRIKASIGKYSDETVLKLRDDASIDFDTDIDAYKLYNNSSCPDLFTKMGDTEYAINNLNSDIDYITVPLKLNAGVSGIHQLVATGLENFDVTDSIILEDKLLNQFQDLKQNQNYACNLSKGDTTTRFYLHFKNAKTNTVNGIIPSQTESVTIVPKGDYISVSFTNPSSPNSDVSVYSLNGELVSEFKNVNTSSESYLPMLGNTNSLYLIKVVLKDKVYAQKITYFR